MDESKDIQIDQKRLQRNLEQQLGGLTVQCCIKDAVIEQLQEEIQQLRAVIARGLPIAAAAANNRPGPGHPAEK
jgi:hypothetical protein